MIKRCIEFLKQFLIKDKCDIDEAGNIHKLSASRWAGVTRRKSSARLHLLVLIYFYPPKIAEDISSEQGICLFRIGWVQYFEFYWERFGCYDYLNAFLNAIWEYFFILYIFYIYTFWYLTFLKHFRFISFNALAYSMSSVSLYTIRHIGVEVDGVPFLAISSIVLRCSLLQEKIKLKNYTWTKLLVL